KPRAVLNAPLPAGTGAPARTGTEIALEQQKHYAGRGQQGSCYRELRAKETNMHRFFPNFVRGGGAFGLLVVRLVVGTAFALHGWPKIYGPLHWMEKMPSPPPAAMQALAAVSEFGGGIALILGLLTPLAALGIAGTMIGALAMVHLPQGHPFVNTFGP